MNLLKRVSQRTLAWHYPAVPVVLGLLLVLPSLSNGLQFDDYGIRSAVLNQQPWGHMAPNPWEPFSFLDGIPEHNDELIDRGVLPWWCDRECRLAFLRPLSALTHQVDYRLWDDRPWLMHVQSLAWFALVIHAASVLYRRLFGHGGPLWGAALAALLFALDDAHGNPIGWLANRNTLLATLFGLLALIAHDRWRRDGWRPGMVLAPAALLAGLLSKELAVCAAAYLAAYAIFLDRGTWYRRLATLLPCLVTGLVWYLVYKMLGFGTMASGAYVDPGHNPGHFLERLIDHGPILLLGQWALPASDLSMGWSSGALIAHWWLSVVFLAGWAVMFVPLIVRDRLARFWTLGMFLSLLVACVPFPGDRLLMFVGFGAMGLLAQWLVGLREKALWLPRLPLWRPAAWGFGCAMIGIHLVLAPLMLPVSVSMPRVVGSRFDPYLRTFPTDPAIARQTAVFVNASWFANMVAVQMQHYHGRPLPLRLINLTASCPTATISRPDATTLVVRPQNGYLPVRDWAFDAEQPPATFALGNMLQMLDLLLRSEKDPMGLGDVVELPDVTIEITALRGDGRPAEATFRFRVPLEDPSLRWIEVTAEGYEPFEPPPVGQTIEVESPFRTVGLP